MECPICHTVSVPNHSTQENVHVIYINTTELNRQRQDNQHKKAAAFCCFLVMGWTIGMMVLDLISRK
jgi:hypothetical protein